MSLGVEVVSYYFTFKLLVMNNQEIAIKILEIINAYVDEFNISLTMLNVPYGGNIMDFVIVETAGYLTPQQMLRLQQIKLP